MALCLSKFSILYHFYTLNYPLTVSKLSSGFSMPQIQLGVYCTSGKETTDSVTWALEVSLWHHSLACYGQASMLH